MEEMILSMNIRIELSYIITLSLLYHVICASAPKCVPESCSHENQTGQCSSDPVSNHLKVGFDGCVGGCYHSCYCYILDTKCSLRPCSAKASCTLPKCSFSPIPTCKCEVGYAGNGFECGPDKDLDGFPDEELACCSSGEEKDPHCCKDNCPDKPNSGQEDADNDGQGDYCDKTPGVPKVKIIPGCSKSRHSNCDKDIDKDGYEYDKDNCPNVSNADQTDTDGDSIGDACDSCPKISNKGQQDKDQDSVGDTCDNDKDEDKDGIQDDRDNCLGVPNADQLDSDNDGQGNACDDDADNDGIPNDEDNCWLYPNPEQRTNDSCLLDSDMDGSDNCHDVCPYNYKIKETNFSSFEQVNFGGRKRNAPEKDANWIIHDHGKEISQTENSKPTLMYGHDVFDNVNYEGTLYQGKEFDDDFMGIVFSYQSNKRFYVVQWKKAKQDNAQPGVAIKRVNSNTGPGRPLSAALYKTGSTNGQAKLLYHDPKRKPWESYISYRWQLIHRPSIGLIRIRFLKGASVFVDSGNIYDVEIKGGKLGVYVDSQDNVVFAGLKYTCNDQVPKEIWDELPPSKQKMVEIDDSGDFWHKIV